MSKGQRIAVFCVGLIACVGAVYWSLTRDPTGTTGRVFNARLECLSCSARFDARLDVGDIPPFRCPQCGERSAWRMKRCHECEAVFTPAPVGDPPRQPMVPTCPECGSRSVGSAPTGS